MLSLGSLTVWFCMPAPGTARRRWSLFRSFILFSTLLIHLIILTTSALALDRAGSARWVHIATIALTGCSLSFPVLFWFHKLCWPEKSKDRMRNITLFSATFVSAFALFILFVVRICQRPNNLLTDYATIGPAKPIGQLLMVLASISLMFAILGVIAARISPYKSIPRKLELRPIVISNPIVDYPTPVPEEVWPETTMKLAQIKAFYAFENQDGDAGLQPPLPHPKDRQWLEIDLK